MHLLYVGSHAASTRRVAVGVVVDNVHYKPVEGKLVGGLQVDV